MRGRFRVLLTVVLLALPLNVLAATPKLAAPPEGETWFTIIVDEQRVGFAHQTITRSGDGYRIDSEGSAKMRLMGRSRESTTRESYLVGPDLAIRSFATDSIIEGTPTSLKGEATPQGIKVAVESRGARKEKSIKVKGAVYPSQALNIYPLLQGTPKGKTAKVPMFDPESLKVKQVKVEVIGEEILPSGVPVVHLQNNLYMVVDNDIWVDLRGNTVKESVRSDLVLTLAEDPKEAQLHLAEDVLANKEMVRDFSLVRVEPIERPEQLKKLSVELTGYPERYPLLQGKGQQGNRLPDGRVVFTMPSDANAPAPSEEPAAAYLQPTATIPSDAPQIAAKKSEILGGEKDPARAAKLLAGWVAKEKGGTQFLKDGGAVERARLYTALARANGIPTRLVTGLLYSPGKGFLYHSWVESWMNGWVPVDPTLGEAPANLTHIKLTEGDAPDDIAALAAFIGKLGAKVVEKEQ